MKRIIVVYLTMLISAEMKNELFANRREHYSIMKTVKLLI